MSTFIFNMWSSPLPDKAQACQLSFWVNKVLYLFWPMISPYKFCSFHLMVLFREMCCTYRKLFRSFSGGVISNFKTFEEESQNSNLRDCLEKEIQRRRGLTQIAQLTPELHKVFIIQPHCISVIVALFLKPLLAQTFSLCHYKHQWEEVVQSLSLCFLQRQILKQGLGSR